MEDRVRDLILAAINTPIDPNLPVPIEIKEIANVESAKPGELVRVFDHTGESAEEDDIYAIDPDGKLTLHKVTPAKPVTLSFVGLQSKLEYVLVNEILPEVDQDALARKKAGIARAMDKEELRRILNAIVSFDGTGGKPNQRVTRGANEDILRLIVRMVQRVEDFGTDYVLLVGSAVSNALGTYEIDNVANFGYEINVKDKLEDLGITLVKVVGRVTGQNLLDPNRLILVARNSKIAAGKPITFIRRQLSPEIAKMMNSESVERAISVAQAPQVITTGGQNLLGYGVFGYESIIEVVTNYRAICWSSLA